MYKVSSHSNHLFVKAARPRAFPVVGTTNHVEPTSRRNIGGREGGVHRSIFPESPREVMTSPTPVFNKPPSKQNCQNGQPAHLSRSHEEMLRFVQTSWQQVMQEYELAREQGNNKVVYYDHTVTKDTNNVLPGFKPVDLEQWYVDRYVSKMGIV